MFKKIVFSIVLIFSMTLSYGQIFGKGNPGYIVPNKGEKLEGFVKTGTQSPNGLISVRYSSTEKGKYKRYKVKKLKAYSLNGNEYIKAKIKTGLFGRKKVLFCKLYKKTPAFTILYSPDDISRGEPANLLIIGSDKYDNITEFHIKKKDEDSYHRITKLKYKKDMMELCGDKATWVEKVNANKDWLRFINLEENLEYYEKN